MVLLLPAWPGWPLSPAPRCGGRLRRALLPSLGSFDYAVSLPRLHHRSDSVNDSALSQEMADYLQGPDASNRGPVLRACIADPVEEILATKWLMRGDCFPGTPVAVPDDHIPSSPVVKKPAM